MKDIQTQSFRCACNDPEHSIEFVYSPEDDDFWINVHLQDLPFFQRIKNAIKYVFGYKTDFGCFGCWMLNSSDIDNLIAMLQSKKLKDKPELSPITFSNNSLSIIARHPNFANLCVEVINFFEEAGGKNFVELQLNNPEKGAYLITVQKQVGMSPAQIIASLRKQIETLKNKEQTGV